MLTLLISTAGIAVQAQTNTDSLFTLLQDKSKSDNTRLVTHEKKKTSLKRGKTAPIIPAQRLINLKARQTQSMTH